MKKIKKAFVGIMAVITAFGASGCANVDLEEFKDKVTGRDEAVSVIPASEYKGLVVQDGGSYAMPTAMAFTAAPMSATTFSETESTFTPVTVDLTVTVTPADANQNVTWEIRFKNADSEWATGKDVKDYVTLTTESTYDTTAEVTCYAPFGEQIEIICTSVENEEMTDTCTVDFLQSVKNLSLTFGDNLPINSGTTEFTWEINENGAGLGGAANVTFDTYDTYTIGEDYTWDIDLRVSSGGGVNYDNENDPAYNDGHLTVDGIRDSQDIKDYKDLYFEPLLNITELCFDRDLMDEVNLGYWDNESFGGGFYVPFTTLSNSEIQSLTIISPVMWQLNLTVTGKETGEAFYLVSDLRLTGFTNVAQVQSLSFSASNITY